MIDAFPDRRDRLFGRDADVQRLVDRARLPGLTVIVGRPLMGKTWTLTEVARRLVEESGCLVGYHESKAAESSHLLYAVSNLYARWLADSTMRQQAVSLWERHKEGLTPRVGKMLGTLFEKVVGNQPPDGVGALVRSAFDGLAEAQNDLQSGGMQIVPLPYDQALSLTRLVAKIGGTRVVLILDAWEKSPSIRSELGTLEAFLKHQEDWPHTHLFLAIRDPELDSTRVSDEVHRRAHDLCRINRAAVICEIPPMDQSDPGENARIVRFVRERVPAATNQAETSILEAIDGYPGVLDFWTSEPHRTSMYTAEDLWREASNAQALRYLEFDHLLSGLQESQRELAARLAFFPRLDSERWLVFRDLLLQDQPETAVHALIDANVLVDESFPTYGHDTRHAAARHWFVEFKRPLMRRVAERIVESLASRITGAISDDKPFFEALIGCSESARQVSTTATMCCMLDAARSVFDGVEKISSQEFDDRCKEAIRRNKLVTPLVAIALLSRGFAKGQNGDDAGSIADYTAVIDLQGSPADEVAQALINRGVKKGRRNDVQGEISDYTDAIELPETDARQVAWALVNRGVRRGQRGDVEGELADYTAAIELPRAWAEQVAQALVNRGVRRGQSGDFKGEIADYTAAIELPHSPTDQIARALINRGIATTIHPPGEGDSSSQLTDYTAAIELPLAPLDLVAEAHVLRAIVKSQIGDDEGAIADYTAAIELPLAPVTEVTQALVNRGAIKSQNGDDCGAIDDYTAAIETAFAPADHVAAALVNRGVIKRRSDDADGAIADYSAAIDLPGACATYVAVALVNRGVVKAKRGDTDAAIVDYETAIDLPDPEPAIIEFARSSLRKL